jgi:hypothetical protein
VTEGVWLTSDSPDVLLGYPSLPTSVRKWLLFGCACCRILRWRFVDKRSWAAVEAVERFIEGEVGDAVVQAAGVEADAAWDDVGPFRGTWRLTGSGQITALASHHLLFPFAWSQATAKSFRASVVEAVAVVRQAVDPRKARQADLLRDVFGNPFRRVAVDPAWLTSTVVALARGIYAEKAFDRLPILADALMDAGCDHAAVLGHCRSDGPHVRGCWVVDLLLGKS